MLENLGNFKTQMISPRNSVSGKNQLGCTVLSRRLRAPYGVQPQCEDCNGSRGEDLAQQSAMLPTAGDLRHHSTPAAPVYLHCTNPFLQLGLGKVPPWFPWASLHEGKFTGKLMGWMRVLITAVGLRAVTGTLHYAS